MWHARALSRRRLDVLFTAELNKCACREDIAGSQPVSFSGWDVASAAGPPDIEHSDRAGDMLAAPAVATTSEAAALAQSSSSGLAPEGRNSRDAALSPERAERIWAAAWQCFDTAPSSRSASQAKPNTKGAGVTRGDRSNASRRSAAPPSAGIPITRAQLALQARILQQSGLSHAVKQAARRLLDNHNGHATQNRRTCLTLSSLFGCGSDTRSGFYRA